MEVDEQIGSDLLGVDIFQDPCLSPTGPLEELICMSFEEEDLDRFSLSLLVDNNNNNNDDSYSNYDTASDASVTSEESFEDRYKTTLKKLEESMKRSQETRKSLWIKTPKTEEYLKHSSVPVVLKSIEKSTLQLQSYLKNMQRV
jgi:hypothetical protein